MPDVPACVVPCRAGLVARSQNAWPSAEWDALALLDVASPFLPYTFFHRRLLRPKFLRQSYLGLLRAFTGLGRLSEGAPAPRAKAKASARAHVAAVGGGAAGVSAALAAAERGARVVLVDDRDTLGGSWRGRGEVRDALQELLRRVGQLPTLEHWPRALCAGLYGGRALGVVTPESLVILQADQVILAPGALDALPLFVNSDLPGVVSARLVERLLTQEGLVPGTQAVVWGVGASAERLADLMRQAGIQIVRRLGPDETVVMAEGPGQVRVAVVQEADGRRQTVGCDLIVIAAVEPRLDLLAHAGGEVRRDEAVGGWTAVRDPWMCTTVPGLRLVGEAAGPADWDRCLAEGRLAGLAAARSLGFDVGSEVESLAREVPPRPAALSLRFPTTSVGGAGLVCFCEDVREREIRREIARGYEAMELIKRRTGVLTGPCQGKFCLTNAMRVSGGTSGAPTARPPAKRIRLGDLVTEEHA